MKRLRRKLHSQSGAALLLAFLLLLLCIMVASSVLAAAASNAGRIKSNRIEQQKYMTLTSAVQLICDDLEKASYTAQYEKYEWTETAADGSGAEKCFHIKQISAAYGGSNKLKDQIPLDKWLNHIFFGGEGYKVASSATADSTLTCTLTVTLPDDLNGYPYKTPGSPQEIYQVDQTVTVQVKIDQATQNITLTAWLGDGDDDPADGVKVTAELVAGMDDPSPLINHHGTGKPLPNPPPESTLETLTSMTWKLSWIKKGE